jgi:Lon protease-like protein
MMCQSDAKSSSGQEIMGGGAMSGDALPLFPLNTVLFPRMPLPLHIFEERYQQMIRRCLEEERPFGVVLIRDGSEAGPPAVPQPVGTLARIHAVKWLPEGRINILTVGAERFRILDYVTDAEPYMVGLTEPVRDAPADPARLAPLVAEATALFHDYFHALLAQTGIEMPDYELPDDPEELSFVLAAVVQADLATRQEFLEMTNTAARLERERDLLEKEVPRLRALGQEAFRQHRTVTTAECRAAFSRN